MTKIAGKLAIAVALLFSFATAASAHHVQGRVLCDADATGTITGPDTLVNNVTVRAVSQTAVPGQTFTDVTGDSTPTGNPGPGAWRINLLARTDDYLVDLSAGLPGGSSVIVPAGGTFLAHIITGSSVTDHVDGIDFLLTGCTPPTTTTTSTTTTTVTTTSTTTTTVTTTTTTTTAPPTTTTVTTTTTTTTAPPTTTTTTTITTTSTTTTSSSTSTTATSTTSTTNTTTPLSACEDALDHYKCYKLIPGAPFARAQANVGDQFGNTDMKIIRPFRFCNPVDKNGEGIIEQTVHQSCYMAKSVPGSPRFRNKRVNIVNQFGSQDLAVTREDSVCTIAKKNQIEPQGTVDGFKCYRVRQEHANSFPPFTVNLSDQFETRTMSIERPMFLCNPASINGATVANPACHLMCYRALQLRTDPEFVPLPVSVEDMFNTTQVNAQQTECRQSTLLCLPSLKTELP